MFRLEMLPARHGDALWIEYGDPRRPHRILVDGGPRAKATQRIITDRLKTRHDLELIVVTHIDADHISGILDVLEDASIPIAARDVWFNGWQHLPADLLGAKQGEAVGAAIMKRRIPWNVDFDEKAVVVSDEGGLPVVSLPGGLDVTLLSPSRRQLAELRPVWKREVERAGLVPGVQAERAAAQADLLGDASIDPSELAADPFVEDGSEANGASIAMLAEFEDRSLLLTGDAHASVLAEGLRRLAHERGVDRIRLDAFKLPHHGSKHNLSSEVLDIVDCEQFLFSTNGDIFGHPDPVAISRIVEGVDEPTLLFNYRAESTERWDSTRMCRRYHYRTVFPEPETAGLLVQL